MPFKSLMMSAAGNKKKKKKRYPWFRETVAAKSIWQYFFSRSSTAFGRQPFIHWATRREAHWKAGKGNGSCTRGRRSNRGIYMMWLMKSGKNEAVARPMHCTHIHSTKVLNVVFLYMQTMLSTKNGGLGIWKSNDFNLLELFLYLQGPNSNGL